MRLAVAKAEGLDEQTIAHVLNADADVAALPVHQQAALALALADAMMTQPSSLPDVVVAELRRHFTPEQLVELTLDVMKWNAQKTSVALATDTWQVPGGLGDLAFDDDGNPVR